VLTRIAIVELIKRFEHPRLQFARDTDAGIANLKPQAHSGNRRLARKHAHTDFAWAKPLLLTLLQCRLARKHAHTDFALIGELDGIADQVE
jgi:hypothetical protein